MSASTRSFRNKHTDLYTNAASCERYDHDLCRRQDEHGAILAAIREVVGAQLDCGSMRVADVGTGTGKLARLLSPHVVSVHATDRSAEIVAVAASSAPGDCSNVTFAHADLRSLPLPDASIDLIVAGWALSYLKSDHEEWYADGSSGGRWREEVDAALAEFDRVLAPGGTLVVLETQGTATESPQRLGSHLYAHLRGAAGLQERSLRTDYRFPSKRAALETLSFFFGKGVSRRAEKLLEGVPDDGTECVVPECTGMWWRRKTSGHGSGKRPRCETGSEEGDHTGGRADG